MLLALILIIITIVLVYQAVQLSKIPKPIREQYKAIIKSCNLRKIGAGISVDDISFAWYSKNPNSFI